MPYTSRARTWQKVFCPLRGLGFGVLGFGFRVPQSRPRRTLRAGEPACVAWEHSHPQSKRSEDCEDRAVHMPYAWQSAPAAGLDGRVPRFAKGPR